MIEHQSDRAETTEGKSTLDEPYVEGRLERTNPYPVTRSSYPDRAGPDDGEGATGDVTVNKRGLGPGIP